MDTTNIKSDNICRCCLQEKSVLKNMVQEFLITSSKQAADNITLFEGYITICTGIELISPTTNHKSICQKCEDFLKISFEFRQLCSDSNAILLERSELIDVKTETLSDTEDNEQESIVYTEYKPPRSKAGKRNPMYQHQVFVVKPAEKVSSPEIKYEEDIEGPEHIGVEVVMKEESQERSTSDDGKPMDADYDSYEDDEDTQKDSKRTHSSGDETLDISLLPGNFACLLCEQMLGHFTEFKLHRKTHLIDSGVNAMDRTCGFCNQHTDRYLHHIKYKHPDYKPNTCRKCDARFNVAGQLQRHLQTHLKGKRYACKGCSKKFANSIELKSHTLKHRHVNNEYQCQECGLCFPQFKDFDTHFHATHHGDTTLRHFYPCFDCKNVFNRRPQAHKHNCDPGYSLNMANMNEEQFKKLHGHKPKAKRKVKKRKGKPEEANYTCKRSCSASFVTEDEMVCHEHSFCRKKKRFICTICDVEFKAPNHLASHMGYKHEERSHICDTCGLKFPQLHSLKAHQVTHSERLVKCGECGATFKGSAGLKSHQKIHTASRRPYECYHCPKTFMSLSGIDRHMAKHMVVTEASHKCTYCEKSFKLLVDKKDHERGHSGTGFVCNVCGNVYTRANILRKHVLHAHNGIRFTCNICHQALGNRSILYHHYFSHRGFKPYKCPECAHEDLTKHRFKSHLKKHNIEYDEIKHGYIEKDPSIRKMLDESMTIIKGETTKRDAAGGKQRKGQGKVRGTTQMEDANVYQGYPTY